jgi:hypothetical protein
VYRNLTVFVVLLCAYTTLVTDQNVFDFDKARRGLLLWANLVEKHMACLQISENGTYQYNNSLQISENGTYQYKNTSTDFRKLHIPVQQYVYRFQKTAHTSITIRLQISENGSYQYNNTSTDFRKWHIPV